MQRRSEYVDFLIVGAGVAGLSAAYSLAEFGRVVVLEKERYAGYHSSGRSLALYSHIYAVPTARALTAASRCFFSRPPAEFRRDSLLSHRGLIYVGTRASSDAFLARSQFMVGAVPALERIPIREAAKLFPSINIDDLADTAIYDKDVFDLDVSTLINGFIRGIEHRNGGSVIFEVELGALVWERGHWRADLSDRFIYGRCVVNAAGAWCDEVAKLAGLDGVGITPTRRSVLVFSSDAGQDSSKWPVLSCCSGERFYLKPEGRNFLGSSANASVAWPTDAQPEDDEIAIAVDRITRLTRLKIPTNIRRWAGLRSFVTDGVPIVSRDEVAPNFYWCVALGGYGIQTSPAVGEICASLVLESEIPESIRAYGVSENQLSVCRDRPKRPCDVDFESFD